MGHRVYTMAYATKEQATEAVNAAFGRTDPYRETYVKAGPYEAIRETTGELCWAVDYEEYYE